MTNVIQFKGKTVTDFTIDGIDKTDYPDFCDTYFSTAIWQDTSKELTDNELERLTNENGDFLNQYAHEWTCYAI